MSRAPNSLTLFVFNVGFGDCFLLRFNYKHDEKRFVLIDFGSTSAPPEPRPNPYSAKVAEQIKHLCDGSLDVIVATHRHKDHISGFAAGAGDIVKSCNPKLVIQPWTEHPRAKRQGTAAPAEFAFVKQLKTMGEVAESMHKFAELDARDGGRRKLFTDRERKVFSFLGENNITNKEAVENLMEMGEAEDAAYVCFGGNPKTKDLLPGVTVDVLGPPSLDQSEEIRKQRDTHAGEYWHLQKEAVSELLTESKKPEAKSTSLFPDHVNLKPPEWTQFGMRKLREIRKESLFSIVRQLDKAMNNTSLILLFTVGGKSLLFPGDAQWENWSYALSDAGVVKKLKDVDVYKVGHHGSLNATPKTLWGLFKHRDSDEQAAGRMIAINSTKHGVHGHTEETEVPRKTLVDELKRDTDYHSTEDIEIDRDSEVFYEKIEIGL